jgi:hypothetical protein
MAQLQKVTTNYYNMLNNTAWKEPFNQATFYNWDPNSGILINQFPLSPALVIGGNTYPAYHTVNLNEGEINDTNYTIDLKGSTTGLVWIVYTEYLTEQP